MRYFPDKMPKGRVPDRDYFFNIVYTFQTDYIAQLIKHANEQRNTPINEEKLVETIEVTDDWWEALNSTPFLSCK